MDGRTADQVIKYCPKCRKSYEIINRNYHYYTDFPSYGKKKIVRPLQMKEKHIIDWILDKTKIDDRKITDKKSAYDIRKIKIDDSICYCEKCNRCWAEVPSYIDPRGYTAYPVGIIPTLNKQRHICPDCKDV